MGSVEFPAGGVVAVAGALPMEIAGLRRQGRFTKASTEDIGYMRGVVRGTDAALFISGMGEGYAYETAKAACAALPLAAYISIGLSGSLSKDLTPGDVVVGDRVKTLASGGFGEYRCDPALVELASSASGYESRPKVGPLLAADRVIATADEKIALMHPYGCIAVDMESAGAARAALQAGVPFIAVRAISDALGEDLPVDFTRFTTDGRLDLPRLIFHVIAHPGTITPLLELGKNSRMAAKNLTAVMLRVMEAMA